MWLNSDLKAVAFNMLSRINVSYDPPHSYQQPLICVDKMAENTFSIQIIKIFRTPIASPPLAAHQNDTKIMSCPEVLYNSCFGYNVLK